MTSINDLQERINSAEKIFNVFKSELDELKAELEALKNQEPEQESLFGRWATHPELGRGFLISARPVGGDVRFARRGNGFTDGTGWIYVHLGDLTLDPATLNTAKDFNDAPEGTIAEIMVEPKGVYVKKDNVWFGAGEEYPTPVQSLAKARVIRWGNGQ